MGSTACRKICTPLSRPRINTVLRLRGGIRGAEGTEANGLRMGAISLQVRFVRAIQAVVILEVARCVVLAPARVFQGSGIIATSLSVSHRISL